MALPFGLIIAGVAQLLDITLKFTAKNPASIPEVAPTVGKLIQIASRAAGETEEETTARLAEHDAIVAQYAAGPPPGADLGGA